MIIQIKFSNVFSFREEQVFSFIPEGLKELKHHLHNPIISNPPEELLKSIAIYGHNSYGKSNFIKTLSFFKDFIKSSFRQPHLYKVEPFLLNEATQDKPSFFEILFYIGDVKYRYGFEIKSNKIISEGLYFAPIGVRENYLFQRVGQDFIISKTWNRENGNKVDVQAIPFATENVLLFSVLAAQEITHIKPIDDKFSTMLIIDKINDDTKREAVEIFSTPDYQELILKFIRNADLGFTSIFDKIERTVRTTHLEKNLLNDWYQEEIRRFQLFSQHEFYNIKNEKIGSVSFEMFKKESDGSIKFFILATLLVHAIKHGSFVCIDELDSKLHTSLLEFIIKEYHNPDVNLSLAQLVFTTHNTILLDKQLRRDQYVVIEKNERGESNMKRLHTKETPVRIDSPIEKEYRRGNLGGTSKKLIEKNKMQGSLDFGGE